MPILTAKFLFSNLTVISDCRPQEPTVTDILHRLTLQLRDTLKRELEWELNKLEDKQHWLTLNKYSSKIVYKLIEDKTTMEDVRPLLSTACSL